MYRTLDEYLLLYSDCIIKVGYKNSIIFDFTRPKNSNFIPDTLVSFINECKEKTIMELYTKYSDVEIEIIEGYIDFILDNEFGYFSPRELKDNFLSYPKMMKKSPEVIDNCMVNLNKFDGVLLKKIKELAEDLLICSFEFRIKNITKSELQLISDIFKNSIVQSINIYCYSSKHEFSLKELEDIRTSNLRIKKICIYNSDSELSNDNDIFIFKKTLKNVEGVKGNVINLSYHLEAENVNTYTFKKLYINSSGEIKNSIQSERVHGNVLQQEIGEIKKILLSDAFTKEWFVPKQKILVCEDCEYNTVCFNDQIPIQFNNGKYGNKKECSYNPYLGKDILEKGYKNLVDSGVSITKNGIVIDHKKIDLINMELDEL